MRLYHITVLAMLFALPASAGAADLAPYPAPAAQCPPPVYMAIPAMDQAHPDALLPEVQNRLSHAIELYQSESVVFNPGPVYTWAAATKLSCGKAIGFLRSREVNALQLNECDCFYRRMVAQLR